MRLPPCPRCHQPLPFAELRVADDLAPCPACGETHRLSQLLASAEKLAAAREHETEISSEPPSGAWRRFEADGVRLGATHRSLAVAALMLGSALFWNGIVTLFVIVATISTLRHFGFEPPLGTGPFRFEPGDTPSGGGLLFLWLFLTPFMFVGACLIVAFLNALCGRTEIRLTANSGTLFSGVGPLGRTRRFDPATARSLRPEFKISASDGDENVTATVLVLECEGAKPLRFASSLSETRRRFLEANLRELLRLPPPADDANTDASRS
jgi:hypothetical protein